MADMPHATMPVATPATPSATLPAKACDAHIHLVAGAAEVPLWENRVEDPAKGLDLDGWLTLYRTHLKTLGLTRCVVVHSILYGADNTVTIEAVRRLGPIARGVGLVTDDGTEAELDVLADANIKAIRLNYVHGGVLSWDGVKRLAPMLAESGMHVQMLMNAHKHMGDLAEDVRRLGVPVVFDHLGWPDLAAGVNEPGFQTLVELVREGDAYVKLSAPYRLCDAPYAAADAAIEALTLANPERCLWGSDWPHLMLGGAGMPDTGDLLNAFLRAVPDPEVQHRILVRTPEKLYGF